MYDEAIVSSVYMTSINGKCIGPGWEVHGRVHVKCYMVYKLYSHGNCKNYVKILFFGKFLTIQYVHTMTVDTVN